MAVFTVLNHVVLTQHINLEHTNETKARNYFKKCLFRFNGAIKGRGFTDVVFGEFCES